LSYACHVYMARSIVVIIHLRYDTHSAAVCVDRLGPRPVRTHDFSHELISCELNLSYRFLCYAPKEAF
jgi:hypothetical protein